MDFEDRPHKDKIFGNVVGRSRLITLSAGPFEPCEKYSDVELDFLQGKQLKDAKTASKFLDEESLQSYVKNQDSGYGWTAEQVWNFEEIEGKRYYTRRVVVKNANGSKSEKSRLVYDYLGPLSEGANAEDDGLAYGDDE